MVNIPNVTIVPMERRYLFAAIASLAVIAVIFSYFDIVRSYSDTYAWWDSFEHFIGGITVGFAALFVVTLFLIPKPALSTVLIVFAVGIAWEIMEYHIGTGGSKYMSYEADTIKDLICDVIGGYAAVRMGSMLRHI